MEMNMDLMAESVEPTPRARRGRPDICVTMDPEVLESMDAECEKLGTTRASLIESALKAWLASSDRIAPVGKLSGGVAPYGSRRVNGRLVDDAEEMKTIARVRELRDKGLSLKKVSVQLAEEGRLSRNGTPFFDQQLTNMLRGGR